MTNSYNKVSILIVEDNIADYMLLTNNLRRDSGSYELHHISDGDEVIPFLEMHTSLPGVIILDINMPRMSGFEVLEQLRSSESYQAIPVIILTGSEDENDVQKSKKLGANGFIVKPGNLTIYDLFSFIEYIAIEPNAFIKVQGLS